MQDTLAVVCKTQHTRHSFVASSSSALLLTDTCRSTVGPGTREDYGRLICARRSPWRKPPRVRRRSAWRSSCRSSMAQRRPTTCISSCRWSYKFCVSSCLNDVLISTLRRARRGSVRATILRCSLMCHGPPGLVGGTRAVEQLVLRPCTWCWRWLWRRSAFRAVDAVPATLVWYTAMMPHGFAKRTMNSVVKAINDFFEEGVTRALPISEGWKKPDYNSAW